MAEGWFTGERLGSYFNANVDDPINARTIINGHDQDTLIAGYHAEFLIALQNSEQSRWMGSH
jgi:putative chitinase